MENTFNDDFNDFIEERINQNFSKLKSNNNYKKLNNLFNNSYYAFINNLNSKDKRELEDLYSMNNKISSYEIFLAYKIGFCDGIKLNNYIN